MTIVLDVDYQVTFKRFASQKSAEIFYTEDRVSFTMVIVFSDKIIRTIVNKETDPETGEVNQDKADMFRLRELLTYTSTQVLAMHNIPKSVRTAIRPNEIEDLTKTEVVENEKPVPIEKPEDVVKVQEQLDELEDEKEKEENGEESDEEDS